MSETAESVRRKIRSAGDLHAVVRTMKALAAANIGQYEQSVRALADYYRTVELGLSVALRNHTRSILITTSRDSDLVTSNVVVFGSDQGLVGQFNDAVADFALNLLTTLPGKKQIWAVGSRVHARLAESKLPLMSPFVVPQSVGAITLLIGQILAGTETLQQRSEVSELHLVYNHPSSGAIYTPVTQRLLPLDESWQKKLVTKSWPSNNLPELFGDHNTTLRALIREHVFVSLFRAAAESLASENASRLSAMQRADKNIDELLNTLNSTFHRMRQDGIDEELFDVISGFEALVKAP